MSQASKAEATQVVPHTLGTALLQLQSEVLSVSKDETADTGKYKYKYLSLDKLLEEVLPKLTELGLLWTTQPRMIGGGEMQNLNPAVIGTPVLYYKLTHIPSDESLDGYFPLMWKSGNPQDLGSALTYLRRYALVTVLNIGTPEDSDGEVSTTQGGGSQRGVRKTNKGKAKQLAERAQRIDALEKLPLAIQHITQGLDVGDITTIDEATAAIQKLDTGQSERLANLIEKKEKEALGIGEGDA